MNPLNQVTIEELSSDYTIELPYRSSRKDHTYTAKITGTEHNDGLVTIQPGVGDKWCTSFEFDHSDPDRVIAIAQAMIGFAQMVKKNNAPAVDEAEPAVVE